MASAVLLKIFTLSVAVSLGVWRFLVSCFSSESQPLLMQGSQQRRNCVEVLSGEKQLQRNVMLARVSRSGILFQTCP